MGDIPGFEPFSFAGTHRELMHTVITKRLNRTLRKSPTNGIFSKQLRAIHS